MPAKKRQIPPLAARGRVPSGEHLPRRQGCTIVRCACGNGRTMTPGRPGSLAPQKRVKLSKLLVTVEVVPTVRVKVPV